jgi:hypothetical protein
MKFCGACLKYWNDDVRVCPTDGVPLELDVWLHRLFADPQRHYYSGPGGVDWMEKTLAQVKILAFAPTHRSAIELREQIEERLPEVAREAEELFRVAETRFSSGDFVGCIQYLLDNVRALREKQAAELRQRVRHKIREGVPMPPGTKEARQLATRLFRDVEDFYIEGIGGIDWAESIVDALDEVLYLSPQLGEAIKLKECIAEILPQCREQAETLFRSAQASFISGDLTNCLDLLGRNAGMACNAR